MSRTQRRKVDALLHRVEPGKDPAPSTDAGMNPSGAVATTRGDATPDLAPRPVARVARAAHRVGHRGRRRGRFAAPRSPAIVRSGRSERAKDIELMVHLFAPSRRQLGGSQEERPDRRYLHGDDGSGAGHCAGPVHRHGG
jgi:hypothetical protein